MKQKKKKSMGKTFTGTFKKKKKKKGNIAEIIM